MYYLVRKDGRGNEEESFREYYTAPSSYSV
jgi:hypothetical protein